MEDDGEETSICDRCSKSIDEEEVNDGTGEWEGCALCNDCCAETKED